MLIYPYDYKRGQLEDIIANLFGEFDKLKDRIDEKSDREMIFR